MKTPLRLFSRIYSNEKLLMAAIFLLSCFVSIIFLVFFAGIGPAGHMKLPSDYAQCYAPIAENVIHGKDIILNKEYVRCAPGYSFLLVPIFLLAEVLGFQRVWLILLANIILTAFSAILLYLIAKHMFGKSVAVLSALLWMTYPFNQWLIKNPNSEVPFITLLLLSIFLYSKLFAHISQKRYAFLTGLALGAAALVRPIGILLPLVFMAFTFLVLNDSIRKKLALCCMIILGSIIFIMPWELYALAKTGDLMPLSSGGPATIREGFYFGARSGEGGDRFKSSEDVMKFMDAIYKEPVKDNRSYGELFSLIAGKAAQNPTAFMKIVFIKIARAWYGTSQMWFEWKIALIQLPYLIFGALGVALAFKKYQEKLPHLLLLLATVGYFWLMVTATLSIFRYMIPAMSLVVMFSALSVSHIAFTISYGRKN